MESETILGPGTNVYIFCELLGWFICLERSLLATFVKPRIPYEGVIKDLINNPVCIPKATMANTVKNKISVTSSEQEIPMAGTKFQNCFTGT